jgi:DNA-binding protein H-NS
MEADMAKEPKESVYDNVITALDALSYDELLKVADAAAKLADSKKSEAKQALIAEFMSRAEGLGLSLVEATGRRGRGPSRKASGGAPAARSVKYRDQNGNSWVGVGPRPAWLKEALDKGATLDDFRV